MQKRVYMFFNFFAFNLLFFALYLNFIHKDVEAALPVLPQPTPVEVSVPAVVRPIEPAVTEKAVVGKTNKNTSTIEKQGEALKLSMN